VSIWNFQKRSGRIPIRVAVCTADSKPGGAKGHGARRRAPAHPNVEAVDKTRTEKIYAISVADLKEFPKYEKIWKEIFKLR
jgi:hypothetical protein